MALVEVGDGLAEREEGEGVVEVGTEVSSAAIAEETGEDESDRVALEAVGLGEAEVTEVGAESSGASSA